MRDMRTIARMLWRPMVLAMCLPAFMASAKDTTQWTLQDLGTLQPGPFFFSSAAAVNNRGDIVGAGSIAGGSHHAFLWQNGQLQDLGVAPGDVSSQLSGINDHGVAAGTGGRIGAAQAYTWKDGQWTALPIGNFSVATGINKRDSVVGFHELPGFNGTESFIFRDGVLFILPTLGGLSSQANAVNDKDVVVGWSVTQQQHQHAFRWDNGAMTDLGTLGGPVSVANAINSHGVIVGQASDAGQGFHAFVYDDGGIRKVPCNVPDTSTSTATGINDSGAIIGTIEGTQRLSPVHGFLCQDGELTVLDDIPAAKASGFTEFMPAGINERGWITGTMRGTQNGLFITHAFVLIPK